MIHFGDFNPGTRYMGQVLTSPTAYIESCPLDYFNTAMGDSVGSPLPTFGYPASFFIQLMIPGANTGDGKPWHTDFWNSFMMQFHPHLTPNFFFHMISSGPDFLWYSQIPGGEKLYSPTNGTMSPGDIWHFSNGKTAP